MTPIFLCEASTCQILLIYMLYFLGKSGGKKVQEKIFFDHVTLIKVKFIPVKKINHFKIIIAKKITYIGLIFREIFNRKNTAAIVL